MFANLVKNFIKRFDSGNRLGHLTGSIKRRIKDPHFSFPIPPICDINERNEVAVTR
jgi:hypothetical protein